MKVKTVANGLFLILLVAIAGCAAMESARHQYVMRGSIVDVADGEIYLCIGNKDGAQVGDEFKVYGINKAYPNLKNAPPSFSRGETGTVEITEIVGEHFARAKILTGKAEMNSIVELNK